MTASDRTCISPARRVPAPGKRPGRLRVLGLVFGVTAGVTMGAGGCQKVLFDQKSPRTQFETHDRLRQRYVPLEEEDVFGNPQPALRARLSPPS